MISHFSQEPFEGTLHIEDADLQKMAKVLNDVNIKECPYFDLSDKYGNSARYYRENQWIPCSERLPDLDEYVLCTLNDSGEGNEVGMMCLTTSIRTDDYYWIDYAGEYSWELCEVFAWMPLPEPWKGEEE